MFTKSLRFARTLLSAPWPFWSDAVRPMAKRASNPPKPTCESCFFRQNLLCALRLDEACATFRPDSPEGLRPPQQMRFAFREERRAQATWSFPSAQEQAALHG